jgi:hypothetical protein
MVTPLTSGLMQGVKKRADMLRHGAPFSLDEVDGVDTVDSMIDGPMSTTSTKSTPSTKVAGLHAWSCAREMELHLWEAKLDPRRPSVGWARIGLPPLRRITPFR